MLTIEAQKTAKDYSNWKGIKKAGGYFGGYWYSYYSNSTPDRTLTLKYKTNAEKRLHKPHNGDNPVIELTPSQSELVYMRVVYDATGNFNPGIATGLALK